MYGFPRRTPEVWRAYRRPPVVDAQRYSNLLVWYRAGDELTTYGLTSATDKSGGGYHTNQVALGVDTGLQVVYYSGTLTMPRPFPSGASPRTFIWVSLSSYTEQSPYKIIPTFAYSSGDNSLFAITGEYSQEFRDHNVFTNRQPLGTRPSTPHVAVYWYDGTTRRFFINETQTSQTTITLTTGSNTHAYLNAYAWRVVEFIAYGSALDIDDVTLISRQLRLQYGFIA